MSYPLRSFPGAALAGTLQTAITNSSTTFSSSTSLASWSDITGNNWTGDVCIAMEYGTANEEKILCTYNQSTGVFTIVNRNYDGTAKVNHAAGSLFVPVFTATEASELNQVTQSLATMLGKTGTSTTPGTIHIGSYSVGTSKFPALADHYHSLEVSDLNGWLNSTAAGTVQAAFYINTTNILAGTLPSGVLLPAAQVSAGTFGASVLLPGGQVSGAGSLALSLLATGALPTAVTTSQIWNPTATTTGTGPSQAGVTGFTKYIVAAWSTELTNASGVDQLGLSITIGATTLINPTKVTVATSSNGTVVTFAYYSTTASSTFTVSSVPTHATPANVTSQTHNLIVIGLN